MTGVLKMIPTGLSCCLALGLTCVSLAQSVLPAPVVEAVPPSQAAPPKPPAPAVVPPNPQATADMLPSDFLDCVSQNTKARWRMLYREATTAAPPAERLKVAFTLGGLLADSYLALQAGHAQQFKNINQDVGKYCSSLGLADKIKPMLMGGSKMAEEEDWPALRSKLNDTHLEIEKLLNEQRDEDLAILVHLGMWIRLFDITTTVVQGDPELQNKTLCIGSIPLLTDLVTRFSKLSQPTKEDPSVAVIGKTLQLLEKHWAATEGRPTQEIVEMTLEKVRFLLGKLTIK